MEFLLEAESGIRLSFFLSTLLVMGILERLYPRRERVAETPMRWFNNIGIVVLNSVVLRLLVPILPVGLAVIFYDKGWGLMPTIGITGLTNIVLTVILLDGIIYFQHVLVHYVPVLWRFHRMHHTDRDLDVTSGNRFHPVEIVFSIGVKLLSVAILGVHPIGVVIFEVILNGMAQFNHANVKIPEAIDRKLRRFIVTPDFHRVHHSYIERETNSNFGFNLSIWDQIFGTYIAEPKKGQIGMDVGLEDYSDPKKLNLLFMLKLPFTKETARVEDSGQQKTA